MTVPDLSLVVPCYNEEEVLGFTVPQLVRAFETVDFKLQLVLTDNGSTDRTGELIQQMYDRFGDVIVPHKVEVNQGYGFGILSGYPKCTGRWVGMIPADGQVDAEDVARLYAAAQATNGRVLAKVRRRFRFDGVKRKVVSVTYNSFFRALWPGVRSLDINGSPKIFPRPILPYLNLESTGWLLDPEVMVKTMTLGFEILEFNVFGRMRGGGTSQVRPAAVVEFMKTLAESKVSQRWREQVDVQGALQALEHWSPNGR